MKRPTEHWGGKRGQSAIEVALMAPWIFFLFIGVLDLGFWGYALMSLENGTRAAGLYAANHPTATAAQLKTVACAELRHVINIAPGCPTVTVTTPTLDTGTNPNRLTFTVTAPLTPMVPIPGLLNVGNVTRQVVVPVLSK
jgi:Flp pilus assembly protein TadG